MIFKQGFYNNKIATLNHLLTKEQYDILHPKKNKYNQKYNQTPSEGEIRNRLLKLLQCSDLDKNAQKKISKLLLASIKNKEALEKEKNHFAALKNNFLTLEIAHRELDFIDKNNENYLEELEQIYQTLDQVSNDVHQSRTAKIDSKSKLKIEHDKLEITTKIVEYIKSFSTTTTEESKKKKNSWLRYIFMPCMLFFGCIWSMSDGYNDSTSLLNLLGHLVHLKNLAHPILFGLGMGFAVIRSFIFLGFDFNKIANICGVSFLNARGIIKIYQKEEEQSRLLNKNLLLNNSIALKQLESLHKITGLIQKDLTQKHRLVSLLNIDTFSTKTLKMSIGTLGGFLAAGGGYYSGQSAVLGILSLCAFSATPFTWWVILLAGTCLIAALAAYIAMERKGLFDLVNKVAGSPKKLENSLHETSNALLQTTTTLQDKINLKKDLEKLTEENQNLKAPKENEAHSLYESKPSTSELLSQFGVLAFSKATKEPTVEIVSATIALKT